MEKLAKYKETIVFVSCATALVGTLVAVQKLTTPSSQHRRHAGSSASHGVARPRSASKGPAGTRSRSSSRLRGNHTGEKTHTTLPSASHPKNNNNNGSSSANVTAADRAHGGHSRDASQAHPHRHHVHPHSANTAAADSKVADAAPAAPTKPLTVEAVAQHTRVLGTASALQIPTETAALVNAAALPSRKPVRSGDGSANDAAVNHRSVSNAATVGSQALFGTSSTVPATGSKAVAAAALDAKVANGAPARSPLPATAVEEVSRGIAVVPTEKRPSNTLEEATEAKDVDERAKMTTTQTQTSKGWFCNDHGTQTEVMEEEDDILALGLANGITPDRHRHKSARAAAAAAMMSPILPSGEANDSTMLNCADLGWTPMRDEGATVCGVDGRPLNVTAKPINPSTLEEVPSYFLAKVETQVSILLRSVARDSGDEGKWMGVYAYLSELPSRVRVALARRDRCGVDSAFVSLAITRAQEMTHLPPPTREGATNEVLTNDRITQCKKDDDCATVTASSLPQEVLHLLQYGAPHAAHSHFEWKGQFCVLAEGGYKPTSREDKGRNKNDNADRHHADNAHASRFAHVRISSSSSSSTSSVSHESNDATEEADVARGALSDVVRVAKHIDKYAPLMDKCVAALTEDAELLRRSSPAAAAAAAAAATTPSPTLLDGDRTPLRRSSGDDDASDESALISQLQRQQQELSSYLHTFAQLTHTDAFVALQQNPLFASFAHDFAEAAASAQHFVACSSTRSPEPSTVLQVPSTQKRYILSEATDARDTSVGTVTSQQSDSLTASGNANRTRPPLKARTPMKPSIRYPLQRGVSSSLSPLAGAK